MSLSTSALYFPLVLAAACYYVYIRISLHRRKARFSKLHGCENLRRAPQNDPFLGLDHFFALGKAAAQRRYLEYFRNLFDEVGPTFGISLMGDDILFTNEPKNIQAVLAKNFADWEIGQRRKDCAAELLGVGVFTSDGETWEHGRAVVRPNFTRKQVSDLKVFEKHIQVLFESLPSDGCSVDLQEWVFRFTLDSGTDVLFGESSNILREDATTVARRFHWAFDVCINVIAQRIRMGKFARFYYNSDFREACKVVHEYVGIIVQKAITQADTWKKAGSKTRDEERYIFLNALAREGVGAKVIADQVLNILVAARDTSACLMSSAFFELSRRPEMQAKLRREVAALQGRLPTFDEIKDMKYLSHFIQETLRLHPPIPLNARVAKRDTVLPSGGGADGSSPIFVEQGKMLVYQVYSMHRRKDLWGVDADVFRPERWESARPTFEFLPFNAGPRICPGQQFALMETSYVIIRFLQQYSQIESTGTGDPWTEKLTLTCSVGQGTWVSLEV